MQVYLKSSKSMRIFLCILLVSFMVASLVGFRDIKEEGGVCRFRARIVDIEKPPPDQKVLVVKKIPSKQEKIKEKGQEVYVILTDETIIGFEDGNMKFDDLTIGMCIEIQGTKIIEKENDHEIVDVYAQRIWPVVE